MVGAEVRESALRVSCSQLRRRGRVNQPRDAGASRSWKGKKQIVPRSPQKERKSARASTLTLSDPFPPEPQVTDLCCVKPLNSWWFVTAVVGSKRAFPQDGRKDRLMKQCLGSAARTVPGTR